uniref:Acid phosphatase n=1 Tax=Ditylenchus dipsaci TaxID=166011 RepID=A0A915EHC6_9BILA
MPIRCNAATSSELIPLFLIYVLLWSANAQRLADIRADIQSLKFVHAIWRHGDRTPSVLIPTDVENNISSWKQGLGELTKLGLSQQYRLGLFLRQRYDGWLSKEYSPFEIYLRSSDYNRTLMSAQANMAGLFTPTRSEVFVKDLNWRPIPVHTMPKGTDKILFDSVFCPAATAEEHNIYSGDEVASIEKENEAVLRDLWMVFDPLNSEFCHSDEHSLPKWVNSSIKDEIWRLYDLSSFFLYESNLLTRLRGGPIFTDILNRMKSVARQQQDRREKFYAYSAHDTTVAGVLAGFGVHPVSFPPYSSMVLVELHQSENGKNFVKLFYKNVTDSNNIWEYDIADCESPCSLEDLEQARLPVIPLNWEEECGLYECCNRSVGSALHRLIHRNITAEFAEPARIG